MHVGVVEFKANVNLCFSITSSADDVALKGRSLYNENRFRELKINLINYGLIREKKMRLLRCT